MRITGYLHPTVARLILLYIWLSVRGYHRYPFGDDHASTPLSLRTTCVSRRYHKTNQILDTEGRYAISSQFSRYGETNDKGFLIWDIQSKDDFTVVHHVLENPKPFVTITTLKVAFRDNIVKARLRLVANHSIPLVKLKCAVDAKEGPLRRLHLNRTAGDREADVGDDFQRKIFETLLCRKI